MVLKSSRRMIAIAGLCGLLLLPTVYARPQPDQERIDTAIALLDRIDRILSSARKKLDTDDLVAIGTTGSSGKVGNVSMSVADLDEIRAELAQIKLLVQRTPPCESVALRPR
jgi:hypothetical protein